MIKFILKGILRDKNRSGLPIIVTVIGVALTVIISGFMKGVFNDVIRQSAIYDTGHVKITTLSFQENKDQLPLDLALLDVGKMCDSLEGLYPDMDWTPRIKFAGILDVLDEKGESKAQGPVTGMAYELMAPDSREYQRLNLENSITRGNKIQHSDEILISEVFANNLDVDIGDEVTYFGSTMNGSMTFKNFKIAGMVSFGMVALDKGALIIDITGAQEMLDMQDGATEVLGYFSQDVFNTEKAAELKSEFNSTQGFITSEIRKLEVTDENQYTPVMLSLVDQNGLEGLIEYSNNISSIIIGTFIFAMSLVLWNIGLLGGLRRYKEFGVRLALGESKAAIYVRLLIEAVIIGIIGSVIGTAIGIAFVLYLQNYGLDFSGLMQDANMMIPNVMRASFTTSLLFIGFIPGLFAKLIGTALAGLGIYKRETANLFKELEV